MSECKGSGLEGSENSIGYGWNSRCITDKIKLFRREPRVSGYMFVMDPFECGVVYRRDAKDLSNLR